VRSAGVSNRIGEIARRAVAPVDDASENLTGGYAGDWDSRSPGFTFAVLLINEAHHFGSDLRSERIFMRIDPVRFGVFHQFLMK